MGSTRAGSLATGKMAGARKINSVLTNAFRLTWNHWKIPSKTSEYVRITITCSVEFCVIEPLGILQELSLDLDSHKNIVMSLNIVVNHVVEHAVTADQRAADRLRSRLAAANSRWDDVCKSAARIQARLQSSLMQNEEYHRTIRDLVTWLERTETDIQGAEPIDLTVGTKQLKAQLTKFQDLYAQLSQFEPRVTSMREIADQVFAQSVEADSAQLRSKLVVLNDRLTSLLKICAQYKQLLDGALRNRGASVSPSTPSGLNLSEMSSPGCKSPRPSIVVFPSHESPSRASSPGVIPAPRPWTSVHLPAQFIPILLF
ncbi:dystonin-like [Daphnia pulex]|uniref:dystonin-like n=1 Tax=Daphnia pulex TaxID=6669 RepID=UPI001EDC99BB|nr:dystonin-like [Daphnia pulex]